MISPLLRWLEARPGKAGALAGWYQQLAGGGVTLAFLPLIEKRLSPGEAGLWFSFQALSTAVALTDFGIGFVLARQVAWSIAAPSAETMGDFIATRPGWQGISDLYAACRTAFGQMIAVGALLMILLHELILPLGRLHHERTASSTAAWYLLGASALVLVRAKQFQAVLDGIGRMHITRFTAGNYQFLAGVAAIAALLATRSLAAMAAVTLAASVGFLALVRWQVQRAAGGELDTHRKAPAGMVRALWRVAAPMGLVNSGSWLISAAQTPLVGSLVGADRVTPFYAAQKIGQMLNAAVAQMVSPQMPLFTQTLARGDRAGAANRMRRIVVTMIAIIIVVNAGYFLFSPAFSRLWRGPKSYPDALTLGVMALDYAAVSSAVVWAQFILAAGRNPFVWTTLAAGLLNLAGCFLLAPRFGLVGIAASSLIGGILTNYLLAPILGGRLLHELRTGGRMRLAKPSDASQTPRASEPQC